MSFRTNMLLKTESKFTLLFHSVIGILNKTNGLLNRIKRHHILELSDPYSHRPIH